MIDISLAEVSMLHCIQSNPGGLRSFFDNLHASNKP